MRSAKPLLPVVLLLTLAAAGCSSGKAEAGPSGGPSSTVVAPGESFPDAGSVQGTVVDDAVTPIRGAQVSLLELHADAVTDAQGAFHIGNVPPGKYRLAAAALGYESVVKIVEVGANANVRVPITLVPIEVESPGYTVFGPMDGYFECREADLASGTGPCPVVSTANDKSSLQFSSRNNTKAFVGEMKWSQGSFATSQRLRLSFSYVGRPSTHWWCTATSGSPIQWNYLIDDDGSGACQSPVYCGIASSQGTTGDYSVPKAKHKLLTYTNTPFACTQTSNLQPVELAFQQHFQIVVTTFHSSVPPPGYSGFLDS